MPVERGVPKGPPRQQVPQSVQECAVKKDATGQIGGYGNKSNTLRGGRWDACQHIAGGYSLSGLEAGACCPLSRSIVSLIARIINGVSFPPVFHHVS